MSRKYEWLTKEILEKDYNLLGSFKLISEKYNVPQTTIKKYFKDFEIKTIPKLNYDINHHLFSTDTEESFYLAGFIAADGCISQHKSNEPNCMTICLSQKDEDHLLKIKNALQFSGPIKNIKSTIKKYPDVIYHMVKFDIYSKQIINDLKKFDIGPRKSLTYNFPEWLNTHPSVNHFMRGYFDGDGSFYLNNETNNERVVFSLRGTTNFLTIFKQILQNKCMIKSISIPKINNGIGQLTIKGQEDVKNIVNYLYANSSIYLNRKRSIVERFLK